MNDLLRTMKEQEEMMRRLGEPLQFLRENDVAMARLRDIAQGIDTSWFLPAIEGTAAAEIALGFDLDKLLPKPSAVAELTKSLFAGMTGIESVATMERYTKQWSEMSESLARVAMPYKALGEQLRSMSACIDATRFAAVTIDWDRVGGLLSASDAARNAVAQLTDRLSLRHAELIASLKIPEALLASVPSFVSELPTLDVFVHTGAVRSVTPHEVFEEQEEQTSMSLRVEIATETGRFLEATLYELKPAFLQQYRGSKMRASDRGPDWWTQGSSSMRKLIKGVLHTTAPNERVLPWAKQNNKALDRNGRPTRATKIDWLCQFVPSDAYRAFVRAELTSALALIDLIDAAQHVDEFPEFEQQYDWTLLRAEVAIRHILTIWKVGGGS